MLPSTEGMTMFDFDADGKRELARPQRDATRGDAVRPTSGSEAAALLHLQRTAGNAGVVQLLSDETAGERSPVHEVVGSGGGSALDDATRTSMESRFGTDFSGVRVHTDARASSSAEAVGANAYTVGSDVVFRAGHFDPGSATGQRTLAHELSHVVQQRSGPVDGTEAPGGIRLSDPGDRFERAADATADQVLSGAASPASPGPAPTLQLEQEGAEESAGAPVQRESMEDDQEDETAAP